jgi:hypothetical protein
MKIKTYKTIILPTVLYRSLILAERYVAGISKQGAEENIWK